MAWVEATWRSAGFETANGVTGFKAGTKFPPDLQSEEKTVDAFYFHFKEHIPAFLDSRAVTYLKDLHHAIQP
jgi:hypothetical protein